MQTTVGDGLGKGRETLDKQRTGDHLRGRVDHSLRDLGNLGSTLQKYLQKSPRFFVGVKTFQLSLPRRTQDEHGLFL